MADVPVNFTGKICGTNLAGKSGQLLQSDYWLEWDWAGWICPQIDYAMAIGCNAIRILGDVSGVQTGRYTQGTYNAHWQQLAAYCAQNNLGLYFVGCSPYGMDAASPNDNGTTGMTDAQIAAIVVSAIVSITSGATDYSANIIGFDILQEAGVLSSSRVNNLYSLVKPNVPSSIGCTFSEAGSVTNLTFISQTINSRDYLDFHIYGTMNTPTEVTANPRAAYPNKDILFGESGVNTAHTSQQTSDWFTGFATLSTMADAKVRGGMFWSMNDHGPGTNNQYGTFDVTWTPRSDRLLPWVKGFSTAAAPSAPPAPKIPHDAVIVVDPRGRSTDYTGVKIYRDGILIATRSYGLFDDAAGIGANSVYTARITTAANGDSALSPPLYIGAQGQAGPAAKSPGAGRFMMPV